MDIVEFLRARLDEDEREAREAAEERRRVGMGDGPDYGFQSWPDVGSPSVLVGPERVLREVEVKRRLLDDLDGYCWDKAEGSPCGRCGRIGCRNLRTLASVYADHPDYNSDWAT